MLMIGYFEGLDSERGIDWKVRDSLSLRSFLGYGLDQQTPDHSTLSRTRHRLPLELHVDVFTWVLKVLAKEKLLKGKTVAVDATTLEANAAMRSIVRRDTEASYLDYIRQLAEESGIETPALEDLRRFDKKRKKKKTSNDDWKHPHDPDAKILKMKDGRTHLTHKVEHVVDVDTNALLAVTLPDQIGDWSLCARRWSRRKRISKPSPPTRKLGKTFTMIRWVKSSRIKDITATTCWWR